jgi:hypothetical protein
MTNKCTLFCFADRPSGNMPVMKPFDALFIFIRHIQPLKMDLTEGSETSAKLNLTPWRHPKEHIQYLSSVYLITTPPHVSGFLVAHHQDVTMYICDNWHVLYVFVDCRRLNPEDIIHRNMSTFNKLNISWVLYFEGQWFNKWGDLKYKYRQPSLYAISLYALSQ